jgi:hypothetical protein
MESAGGLVATLSHFLKLRSELELLGSRLDADLIDYQVDGLWPLLTTASDSLASLVPSLISHDPPDDVGE